MVSSIDTMRCYPESTDHLPASQSALEAAKLSQKQGIHEVDEPDRALRGRVGSADRIQRIVIGSILLGLNAVGLAQDPDWVRWASLVVQIELIGSALVGWCPLYWSFGANSCPKGSSE